MLDINFFNLYGITEEDRVRLKRLINS